MTKFYFAYDSIDGLLFPFRWSETDGHAEGGDFRVTAVQVREISHYEYHDETLKQTVLRYPFVFGEADKTK